MRILYVLNGFDQGGAERGLVELVENGAFEDHELRILALCRGRGGLANRVVDRLGQRVQFVTDSDALTFRACSAGFFTILRTSFAFRPEKLVLSLKQANVVGRSAAMLMPGLTCVAFEHTGEYRARRFQGLYGPLLRLLSVRVNEVWADSAETLEQTRRYFLPRRREGHVRVPLSWLGARRRSRPTMRSDPASAWPPPEGSLQERIWQPSSRRWPCCGRRASRRRSTSTATALRERRSRRCLLTVAFWIT